ncbi:MAG: TlpA family protein disulfide reductase [Methylococcaceae bacterium]|nr:TlpA family protein disulfide reductase [Methylococcaceae bacterium]
MLVQPTKINAWVKGCIIFLLISLPLWLSKHNPYTFLPDTVFTTITGQKVALKDLHGKPAIITFWATTCPSCVKEIPHLIELHEKFHPQGIEIIAIAMNYDPPNRVVNMTQERKLPYHVVLDITGNYAKAFGHVWATPTTLLINGNGDVSKRILGPFNLKDVESRIEHLLQVKTAFFRSIKKNTG